MDKDAGYDTTNLHLLRQELARFNALARESGLIVPDSPVSRSPVAPPPTRTKTATAAAKRRAKAVVKRILATAGRIDGDSSPAVPGTPFSASGVVRLLAHLRKSRKAATPGRRLRLRLLRYLTRPLAGGLQTTAGIGVERLQVVYRQLSDIETYGWDHLRAVRAGRRLHRSGRTALTKPQASDQPVHETADSN